MLARYTVNFWDELDVETKTISGILGCGGSTFCDAVAEVTKYYGEKNINWLKVAIPTYDNVAEEMSDEEDWLLGRKELDDCE